MWLISCAPKIPCRPSKRIQTYANEQGRDGGQDRQSKEQRDHLGRAAGVGAEDVMNLGLLAVPQRLLVGWGRGARVKLDLDVENRCVETLRGPERADDD
jgi:hypothetical protein